MVHLHAAVRFLDELITNIRVLPAYDRIERELHILGDAQMATPAF